MRLSDLITEYLMSMLAKMLQKEKTRLLMGDFNINLLNTDTNPKVSQFYNILLSIFLLFIIYSQQGCQKF